MTQTSFILRPAQAADIANLQRIEDDSFTTAEYRDQKLSRASMRRLIRTETAEFIVAERTERTAKNSADFATNQPLLGYILVFYRRGSRKARIYSLAVHPQAQGMGVGKGLMEACYMRALNKNCDSVILEVASENTRLIKLYEGQGFKKIAELPDYYGEGLSGIKMSRALNTPP